MGGFATVLPMAMQAAGSLIQGLGSSSQASASASASSANAQTMMMNAMLARADAQRRAMYEREQARRFASSQKAAYGATGVSADSQSAMEVMAHTDVQGELAAMEALYAGEREAAGYASGADQASRQAAAYRSQGSGNLIAGILGAGQAFLPLLKKLG